MELTKPYENRSFEFKVLNPDDNMPVRQIISPLSPRQIEQVGREGFVVLRGYLRPQLIDSFRIIVDAACHTKYGNSKKDTYSSGRFGGQFIRDLHSVSEEAWSYLQESGIPDLVRSMIGPRIVLRSYSARVTYPDSGSLTVWHCDQRARATPSQPWAADAPSVTVIVYLDAADEDSGRTELIPASHTRWALPDDNQLSQEDIDSSVVVTALPGDLMMFHGALWHRAGATHTKLRRVLNLQFAPSWTRRSHFEAEGENPAWVTVAEKARASGQSDELELLGLGGYM